MRLINENVDWVTVRAGCTGEGVFLKLKEEVRRDVETRVKLRKEPHYYSFKFMDDGESFTVSLEWNRKGQWVSFRFVGDRIFATDHTGKEIVAATVTMSREGVCALAIPEDSQDTSETWEFRFKALQRLFFIAPNET